MNNSDFINLIEPTPKLMSKKCRFFAKSIEYLLKLFTPLAALIVWYMYDYFIAGAVFLLSFIIVGIIRAKLRNSAIPLTQQEYHYNDAAIASWYSAKYLCLGENNEEK